MIAFDTTFRSLAFSRRNLIAGGAALDRAVDEIMEAMAGRAHIFNLGHGILPETPIAHVEQLLKRIRQGSTI